MGTTQPEASRRRMAWLPFCRIKENPRRVNALMVSFPETQGNLGMRQPGLECGENRMTVYGRGKLLKIKFRGLLQVRDSFFHGFPLGGCAGFGIECHEPVAASIGIHHCG